MKEKTRINPSEHLRHPLKVHTLLSDYEIEDVWRFPIRMKPDQSLDLFLKLFKESNASLSEKGLAGALFRFRMWLGKLFGWDRHTPPESLIDGTLRHRYAMQEGLSFADLPDLGIGHFVPVYQLENEFLSEIENKTVKAALHLSRVPHRDHFALQMAVYVKPKGSFGRFYMALIKPFRLWIVYPAMMRMAGEKWRKNFSN